MSKVSDTDVRTWESLLAPTSPPSSRDASSGVSGAVPPPIRPIQGHARSMTFSGRNTNRLSLNFPVQTVDKRSSLKATPTQSESSTATTATADHASKDTPSPAKDLDFMEVLAAQERKVLELKEELLRAEAELGKLKRQWAIHESNRKRAELKGGQQLKPIQTRQDFQEKADEDPEDAILRRSVELDRRKAMLMGATKDSKRKVISGAHTRTLSLLSPERNNTFNAPTFPTVDEKSPLETPARPPSIKSYEGKTSSTRILPGSRTQLPYQEAAASATVGVKQIVEDLRAGLWTFAEDLRQATIGSEAAQSPPSHLGVDSAGRISRKHSKGSLRNSRQQSRSRNQSTSRTRQAGLKKSMQHEHKEEKQEKLLIDVSTPRSSKKTDSGIGVDDDWSNWDSPVSSLKSPGWTDGFPSTQARGELPENASKAMRDTPSSKDGIPWPALETLSPGNLKRTASAFMKEFERSLTPSPGEQEDKSKDFGELNSSREQEARLYLSNLP